MVLTVTQLEWQIKKNKAILRKAGARLWWTDDVENEILCSLNSIELSAKVLRRLCQHNYFVYSSNIINIRPLPARNVTSVESHVDIFGRWWRALISLSCFSSAEIGVVVYRLIVWVLKDRCYALYPYLWVFDRVIESFDQSINFQTACIGQTLYCEWVQRYTWAETFD